MDLYTRDRGGDVAEGGVAIVQQIPRACVAGERVTELLRGPAGGRLFRDRDLYDPSPLVREDDEHEQQPVRHGRHDEVGRHDLCEVIRQDRDENLKPSGRTDFPVGTGAKPVDLDAPWLQNGGIREEAMATLNVKNLPDALYRKLQARAKRQRRSVAQEVTQILSDVLESPKALSILELQGLGKEDWRDVDAATHVERERAAWD